MSSDEAYKNAIENAAENRTDEYILNATMAHAEIGIRALFTHAESKATAKVIAADFMTSFWSRLKEDISGFINGKEGKMEVIVMKEPSAFLKELKDEFKGKVEVYQIPEQIQKQIQPKGSTIPHIVAMTSGGYRFEESDDERDKEIVKGVLNYGNKNNTDRLVNYFDALRGSATKIS